MRKCPVFIGNTQSRDVQEWDFVLYCSYSTPCTNFIGVLKFWKRDYWVKKKKLFQSTIHRIVASLWMVLFMSVFLLVCSPQVAWGLWGQGAGSTQHPPCCVRFPREDPGSSHLPQLLERSSYWMWVLSYLPSFSRPRTLQVIPPKRNSSILVNVLKTQFLAMAMIGNKVGYF